MSNVSGVIKSIQDVMRKDVGVDGDAQRISQLVWMFFLKILDDREEELELVDDDFISPIPDHLRWRNWAADREGVTGEALLDFVNLQLFPKLKGDLTATGETAKRAKIVRDVFEDTYNYMKSGTLMRQVINKINEIDFNNSEDRHTFGAIYEQILKDLQSAGNAGEFYTPRAVTRFIIDRLDPKLNEVVFDPACGTGGFLSCAIEHKRKSVRNNDDEAMLQKTIRGVEKKALPHMLCITNMILNGIDTPSGIRHGNTLEKAYRDYGEKDRVPVIATNPPFGGMEQDGIETNFPANLRTRETADLFMALIIKLLKGNGRAAVVLPDGFLFGEGVKTTLKQSLIEECNLHTIVRLPPSVFAPYTNIKTNILFFTKGTPTKQIWFYEHPLPKGVKAYNKTLPLQFEEFEAIQAWWGDEANGFRARKVTEQAWKISAADVTSSGYKLDMKNPHEVETKEFDVDELLREYATHQKHVHSLRKQLKSILADALSGQGMSKSNSALVLENKKVSFVPMPLISNRTDGAHNAETRRWGEIKKGYTHFANGDVGLAKITPCFENEKAVVFEDLESGVGAGTTELHIARPLIDDIDRRFLLLTMKTPSYLENGEAKMTGTAGQKRVPRSYFELTPFALPPISEQKRIVAKVDELIALCEQLKSCLANAAETQRNLADAITLKAAI